ncbi:uncharacterized protein KY384_000246 [Bacidia gigantensis]|uniref:uncharacterized protein n=1 Tax=Bacidia gigantensis TaxID=2732470 RepID=UPI001D049B84|nr:uncharacterized protein KY384_000246 [Bacidia gigantensis]KAG8526253.1 hypothetical protein KY384_000246 [Bacidia gigantensis]
MPLLSNGQYRAHDLHQNIGDLSDNTGKKPASSHRHSQHSGMAKTAIMSHFSTSSTESIRTSDAERAKAQQSHGSGPNEGLLTSPSNGAKKAGVVDGKALSDTPCSTPATTTPNSPIIPPIRRDSGSPRLRPRAATTLDIPGLTKSKVSPDGKISQRDVGSKLVIVMVGLPARGKSYITKKLARYLNWLQHDTRIFNVGERRRGVAGPSVTRSKTDRHYQTITLREISMVTASLNGLLREQNLTTPPTSPSTRILINGDMPPETPPLERLPPAALEMSESKANTEADHLECPDEEARADAGDPSPGQSLEQTASFFDPSNEKAASIREQVAMETLDEMLDYILDRGGSVGIFDATNSTPKRRKAIMDRVRARAGPDLGILFLESLCIDETLLESNMRLKLSGPDYKEQDPVLALEDFKKRVSMYRKTYVSLGNYEEENNMQYIQMIDVGRKIISHQIRGFLSAQTNYFLLNFNLAPRQIWITRHGESRDNIMGKIGGDSDLTEGGHAYAKTLTAFVKDQREIWEVRQQDKAVSTHFPPQPGDTTPPNPEYSTSESQDSVKSFCVWTSMLKRSIQTAQYFDEEEFEIKQMRMLDELNAGIMEGLTYEDIRQKYAADYELRKRDKLHYRYPGPGGEGYLDIINRLRPVIHEVERMTDHVLLVGHRSVARVLLAYFMGLKREDVADLVAPLGMLYMLEPVSKTREVRRRQSLTAPRNPMGSSLRHIGIMQRPSGLTLSQIMSYRRLNNRPLTD